MQYDLSPCGTGTSAKLAIMASQGKIKTGQKLVSKSVTDSSFVGQILRQERLNGWDVIIPLITGHVRSVGYHFADVQLLDDFTFGTLTLYDEPKGRCWNSNQSNVSELDRGYHDELETAADVFNRSG